MGATKGYWVTGFSPSLVKNYHHQSHHCQQILTAQFIIDLIRNHQVEGTVHHMAVVGCGARMETPRNLWNCGANGEPALEPGYPSLTPCHSEVGTQYSRSSFYSSPRIFEDNTTTTLYLWSRGGEAVTLPPDTGMIFVKYSFFVKLMTNITLLLDSGFPVGGPSTIQYLVLQVGLQLLGVLHQIINGQK